ncbi:MAG: DoxX family protein [Proteobacteria bacterium]|nr:MAG: DoxX family protein [Pseudomonadota bacterium]
MKFLVGFFSFGWLRVFDFLAPLAIRLLMAPVLWVSGSQRLGFLTAADSAWWNTSTWVNYETVQANAAALTGSVVSGVVGTETLTLLVGSIEMVGAFLLILGFAARWVALALMFVIVVLGSLSLGDASLLATMKQLLMQYGYTTVQQGSFTLYLVYFVFLLALFFMGAGRWFSLDWYIYRHFVPKSAHSLSDEHDPFEIDATNEPELQRRA